MVDFQIFQLQQAVYCLFFHVYEANHQDRSLTCQKPDNGNYPCSRVLQLIFIYSWNLKN